MGTPFNDIATRNIGANGQVFDPALPPIQELAYATVPPLLGELGLLGYRLHSLERKGR